MAPRVPRGAPNLTITYTADGRPVHFSLAICRLQGRLSRVGSATPLKKPASYRVARKAKTSERSARWDSLTTHQTTADATRETTGRLPCQHGLAGIRLAHVETPLQRLSDQGERQHKTGTLNRLHSDV